RRLLSEGLAAAGLDAAAVKQLKGSDARKVAIASVIWQNTTVSMSWIAERLSLKSAANASQQLGRCRKGMKNCRPHCANGQICQDMSPDPFWGFPTHLARSLYMES
ncbi:MAG: hypothetical protein H0W20_14795, partial [Chthoniobacterales bacterium]|nr:hypothetical protein [Chthoniobacterales bacterium]